MRYFLRIMLLLGIMLSVQACNYQRVQYGYPEHVKFSKNGGQKQVSGDIALLGFYIYDRDCNGISGPFFKPDEDWLAPYTVTYDWLTIEHRLESPEFTLIAEPNNTNKKRSLTIESYFGYDYVQIKVTQDK